MTVYFAHYAAVPWTDWIADQWKNAEGTLGRAIELCRERERRLLLCFVPIKFRVYKDELETPPDSPLLKWKVWPLDRLFTEFCDSVEAPCLDLTPILRDAVRRGGMPYAARDSHWSAEGAGPGGGAGAEAPRGARLGRGAYS